MSIKFERFLKKFNSIKLSRKLIYIIFVAMFLFVTFFISVQYISVRKYVINQNEHAIHQNYDQSYRLLTKIVDNYFRAISAMESMPDISNVIYGKVKFDFADDQQQLEMHRQYNAFCQSVYNVENIYDIDAINIYTMDGYICSTDNVSKFPAEKIKKTRWYNQMKSMGTQSFLCNSSYFDDDESDTDGKIHYIRLIPSRDKYTENIAAVRVSINESKIRFILDSCKMTDNNIILLRSTKINNISYVGLKNYDAGFLNALYDYIDNSEVDTSNFEYGNKKFYIVQRKISFSSVEFIDVFPTGDLLKTYYDLNVNICIILIAMFIIISVLLNSILKTFTQRIEKLMGAMNDVKQNKFTLVSAGEIDDDLDDCIRNYNDMICRVQTMMEEQLKNRQTLHNYEIRLLYEQINPHFLFNVLEIINSLTYENDVPAIRESIQKLAQYYKISLNNASEIIKIRDEIKHCELYVDICSKRFGKNIELDYDIDDDLLDVPILKMTLQPIAENAIVHGFRVKDEIVGRNNEIFVAAYRSDGYIFIEVTDNGVGIEHEKLGCVLSDKNKSGIGLKNTDERLKLYYGENCGISIKSEFGKYTTVVIKITDKTS